jgi:hypothetical protein
MYTIQSITQSIAGLSQSVKHKLFQLLSKNTDLLDKILPGLPLIDHATGRQHLTHTLAEEYDAWLNTKT